MPPRPPSLVAATASSYLSFQNPLSSFRNLASPFSHHKHKKDDIAAPPLASHLPSTICTAHRPPMASTLALSSSLSSLRTVRLPHCLLAICHLGLFGSAVWGVVSALQFCPGAAVVASFITAAASAVRILWMLGSAVTQAAVASTIMAEELDLSDSIIATQEKRKSRRERRMRYACWLWWGRLGSVVTLLQLIGAAYFSFFIVKYASSGPNRCNSAGDLSRLHQHLFLSLAVMAWVLAIMQCCIGSDILAWSSLYGGHSEAWRAYYHEMFDYGIREALCCLGRAQYIIPQDEDDVDSVAAVLGDLVSYRAAGAGHLEFLAGLALLQIQQPQQLSVLQFTPAPEAVIREAAKLHPYAVAAYTGPLLDVGRNPLVFPCVWLYRQGVLTFWKWNRWPHLEGDNWWRGHAAAFLKHLNLPPDTLRRGRIYQAKRESAYFVTVVHHCQWVVVAVRGTETPEDLLTDGLGRKCMLTESDLQGLLESKHIPVTSKQRLLSTMPHFGHEGIIQAARELALQLDNISDKDSGVCNRHCFSTLIDDEIDSSKQMGLLSSLLGAGGECEGYSLLFVGHSLGGSIAALTAIRLYARYPQVRVYGYGVLPCVDEVIADACSSFVTSIVYNDEFSSRLSISSVKRLRTAAVKALAAETSSDAGTITRLARRLFGSAQPVEFISSSGKNDWQLTKEITVMSRENRHKQRRYKFKLKGCICLCSHACHCMLHMSNHGSAEPVNVVQREFTQDNAYVGPCHSNVVESHQQNISSLLHPCEEKVIMVPVDGKKILPPSSRVDDPVADEEGVCLDAGDSNGDSAPEESEVLLIADEKGGHGCHSEIVQINREESFDPQNNPRGEACTEQEGKQQECAQDTFHCGHCGQENQKMVSEYEGENLGEIFLPGLIIHLVPIDKEVSNSWKGWRKSQLRYHHRAYIKDRRSFQDIVVSPSMFLDHMPWRCQYALNSVVDYKEATRPGSHLGSDCIV